MRGVVPILFVSDVPASAAFFRDVLGFKIDFLHGSPPFYGAVSRGQACLHLRFVHRPVIAADAAAAEEGLIFASVEVSDVAALFEEFKAKGAIFPQTLTRQPWGGTDFHVVDPDGNAISFVEF